MKILHIITSLQVGGAEKLILDLMPLFKRNGIEADVLLLDGSDTPFKQELSGQGVRIFEAGRGSVYNPLLVFKMLPYFKSYDIIHTHNFTPQLFAAMGSLLRPVPLATTEHSTYNRRRPLKWYHPIDRWMYGRYQKIICISDKAEEELRRYLKKKHDGICTIHNGINLRRFTDAEADPDILGKYGTCKRLMMVARFAPAKDQKTVIATMSLLSPDYHVFFAGDGECRPACEEMANTLGLADRVHFLGIRTDIPRLFASADIAILSSHWEGLPLSAIEAMATHKPLIASDVKGITEVVNGAGILFEHENAEDLAKKIVDLCSDIALYRETADACLRRAAEYDISKMAQRYEEIYSSMVQ